MAKTVKKSDFSAGGILIKSEGRGAFYLDTLGTPFSALFGEVISDLIRR